MKKGRKFVKKIKRKTKEENLLKNINFKKKKRKKIE